MTDLNPVDAMTTDYRALCAELIEAVLSDDSHIDCVQIARRARALLAQPVAEVPKPVVDYSRVPEIATESQIRSAAQYLVKKQNCDGDLIPAIKYAIARWGHPTPQPVAQEEDCPGCEGTPVASNSPCAVCGRAVLARWGHPTPQPVAEEPTITNSTLHRQELTPSEVTLLNTFWRSR